MRARWIAWLEPPAWLSRETSSRAFIPQVDGLRFVALAAVLLHHVTAAYLESTECLGPVDLPEQWWDVFRRSTAVAVGYAGHFGVHLFFVISGFVLALPYVESYRRAGPQPGLGAYYLRRLARLEPPYVISMAVAFLVIVTTNEGWREFASHFVPSILYLHGPIFGQASWINGVAWSLEVEVQFYVLVPLLARVFALRSRIVRRGVLVSSILVTAWLAGAFIDAEATPRLALSLAKYLQFFLAGFVLADLYEDRADSITSRHLGWDAMTLTAAGSIYVILTRHYDLFFFTPLLVVVLYVGAFLGRLGHAFISQRWIVVAGGMCYSVYLYHFLIIDRLMPYTAPWTSGGHALSVDLVLQCLILAVPIAGVSTLAFVLVEKPCMRLSRSVARRRAVLITR